MARSAGRYRPEKPRRGTEKQTVERNTDNIFRILNDHDRQLANLRESVASGSSISISIGTAAEDIEEFALMVSTIE